MFFFKLTVSVFADMFRGGLTGLARTGLVDCPGPELVNLFFLQATHEGLERGGPVGFENF